mmetsp:Transcript_89646/g.179153  ORF Transcript_89646/g.179153 Transcript_89646/m.179153 type:complete len:463 (+) Transcript_89646:310-1698(+)
MYNLSYHYYSKKNDQLFVTPSIVLTSVASLLSFLATSLPQYGQRLSLLVGFLGTCATVLTSLRSQYLFDARAEMFSSAASDYALIALKLKAKLRKSEVTVEAWALAWREIDARMEEIQKRLTVFPPQRLVQRWRVEGRFTPQGDSKYGGLMPPWAEKHRTLLAEDGVRSAEDMEHVDDDALYAWDESGRYPPVVVRKVLDMREHLKESRNNPGQSFGTPASAGLQLRGCVLKPSTVEAFRKRGVDENRKLRLCTDKILDSIVDELIEREVAPFPEHWKEIEVASLLFKKYGDGVYSIARKLLKGGCIPPVQLDPRAKVRLEKVAGADRVVVNGVSKKKSDLMRKGAEGKENVQTAKPVVAEEGKSALSGGGGGGGGENAAQQAIHSQSLAAKRVGKKSGSMAEEGGETESLLGNTTSMPSKKPQTPIAKRISGAGASASDSHGNAKKNIGYSSVYGNKNKGK